MVRKLYGEDEKLRILAIASVRGIPFASKAFGVNRETITIWQAERGDDDKLKLASDLALSELTLEIAEGKGRAGLATKAGILMDKAARYYRPKEPVVPKDPAEVWGDELMAALEARYSETEVDTILDILIRRDMDLVGREETDETEAMVLDIAAIVAWVEDLGDFDAWLEADRAARHDAMEAQLERNRKVAAAEQLAVLDAETQALIAAAEAFLAVSDAA